MGERAEEVGTREAVLSLDEAHGIVQEGRAYTVEHFGFTRTSYVGHTSANLYDRAVDRLVEGVAELVAENERLMKVRDIADAYISEYDKADEDGNVARWQALHDALAEADR